MITHTRSMPRIVGLGADVCQAVLAEAVSRAARHVGQMWCGITGHNVLLRYEPTRLSLQCETCGYESPGWQVGPGRAQN
jgi:hypothetical protein